MLTVSIEWFLLCLKMRDVPWFMFVVRDLLPQALSLYGSLPCDRLATYPERQTTIHTQWAIWNHKLTSPLHVVEVSHKQTRGEPPDIHQMLDLKPSCYEASASHCAAFSWLLICKLSWPPIKRGGEWLQSQHCKIVKMYTQPDAGQQTLVYFSLFSKTFHNITSCKLKN